MNGLARQILEETYGIDSDQYDDGQLYDIIELINKEIEDRIIIREDNWNENFWVSSVGTIHPNNYTDTNMEIAKARLNYKESPWQIDV